MKFLPHKEDSVLLHAQNTVSSKQTNRLMQLMDITLFSRNIPIFSHLALLYIYHVYNNCYMFRCFIYATIK